MVLVAISGVMLFFGVLTFLGSVSLAASLQGTDKLFASLQRLVVANNINRAIKMCNQDDTLVAKAAKHLLIRANRPYQLELAYHEALNEHLAPQDVSFKAVRTLATLAAVLGGIIAMASHVETVPDYVAYMLAAYLVSVIGTTAAASQFYHGLERARVGLLRLRNLLYVRTGYVPPAYTPVKEEDLTPERLREWRDSMSAFERDIVRRKENGEDVDPNTEYHSKSEPEGVLPPL